MTEQPKVKQHQRKSEADKDGHGGRLSLTGNRSIGRCAGGRRGPCLGAANRKGTAASPNSASFASRTESRSLIVRRCAGSRVSDKTSRPRRARSSSFVRSSLAILYTSPSSASAGFKSAWDQTDSRRSRSRASDNGSDQPLSSGGADKHAFPAYGS